MALAVRHRIEDIEFLDGQSDRRPVSVARVKLDCLPNLKEDKGGFG